MYAATLWWGASVIATTQQTLQGAESQFVISALNGY